MNSAIKAIGLTLLAAGSLAIGTGVGWELHREPDAATTQPTDESAAPTASVETQPLRHGTLTQTVTGYGTVQPAAAAAIALSMPFDTQVQNVLVEAGRHVDEGIPIIEVRATSEMQLQLQQAEDALTAADTNVEQARHRRDQQLATNADVSAAEQAQRVAQTQVRSLIQRGIGQSTTLKAPVAGIVTQLNAQRGQTVSSGTALAVLSPATDLQAIVGCDPSAAAKIEPGAEVVLRDVHADASESLIAHVATVMQQIDAQTHLRQVIVSLPSDSKLLVGMFVAAALPTEHDEGWVVPRAAVQPDDDAQVLFVNESGKAKRHEVKITLSNRDAYLISDDTLHDGDAIIVSGNTELEDGMAVLVAAPSASTTAEAKK